MVEKSANVWEIVTAVATAITAITAIVIAIHSTRSARAAKQRASMSALDSIDSTIIELERDAPSVIFSATHTVPQVVGFRFQTEQAGRHLQELREVAAVSEDEYQAIAYVLRQANDANRAMDMTQEIGLIDAEGVRQLGLISVKARHLLETGDSGFTRCQIARKAISSARKRLRG